MRSILEVARREYIAYVSAWGFWLGLILTPLGLFVGVALPAMLARAQPVRYFTVIDTRTDFADALVRELEDWRAEEARAVLSAALSSSAREEREAAIRRFADARASGLDSDQALARANAPVAVKAPARSYFRVDPPAATLDALRPWLSGASEVAGPQGPKPFFAAFVVTRQPDGRISEIAYWSEDVVANDLTNAGFGALREMARASVLVAAGLDPDVLEKADLDLPAIVERKLGAGDEAVEVSNADKAPFFAAAMVSMVLWLLVFSIVNFLIMGTIEERSNKIFDMLLTSVRLTHLLAGKLLGVLALSATLMGTWALFAAAILLRTADPGVLALVSAAAQPELVAAAVTGFIAGYVMYAALFLALGSLCDTIQEAQTLMSPLFIFLMVPLFVVIIAIRTPNSPLVEALSWFPPFTPFLMILRAPLSPPLWQVLAQTAMMAAFAGLALWASVRVYRAGAVNGAGIAQVFGWLGRRAKPVK